MPWKPLCFPLLKPILSVHHWFHNSFHPLFFVKLSCSKILYVFIKAQSNGGYSNVKSRLSPDRLIFSLPRNWTLPLLLKLQNFFFDCFTTKPFVGWANWLLWLHCLVLSLGHNTWSHGLFAGASERPFDKSLNMRLPNCISLLECFVIELLRQLVLLERAISVVVEVGSRCLRVLVGLIVFSSFYFFKLLRMGCRLKIQNGL